MAKKKLAVVYLLALVFFVAIVVNSQVKEPQIPRSWWSSVKDYINKKSESKILSFVHYGEPTDQIMGIFTPKSDITIQRIDIFARAKVDSDTTAFIMTNGINTSKVMMDSGSSKKLWFSSTDVMFKKLLPCTLRFSDNSYSGAFVSGADTPMVIIQYKVTD
jgi:hypothetical protein